MTRKNWFSGKNPLLSRRKKLSRSSSGSAAELIRIRRTRLGMEILEPRMVLANEVISPIGPEKLLKNGSTTNDVRGIDRKVF